MVKLILLVILVLYWPFSLAETKVLYADYRHRPPEMVRVEGADTFFGPLRDILEDAAYRIGYSVVWRFAPFPRSLDDLKKGRIDIIPRTIKTKKREAFVAYIGPIGFQQKDIFFLVKKGQEDLINSYEDLYRHRIGVKRKTAYFPKFDNDKRIQKMLSLDDKNMAEMISKNRFPVMIVLDTSSIESALKKIGFTNYSYANYKHQQRIGNYYGMSKKSPNAPVYEKLNEAILNMVKTGRVDEYYKKYNIIPPLHEH
ncbi:transporter substrate-binding domain-containing protein [Endozoicomonas sp. SM1973]|uniref:Transporter substrate-binding domain-containing protein n=1 Tax=Spartinivicinus marinus TaxID=2994442 RepID=A0A853IFF3_9GAMM|nr:transporter substrate-binding domain-containing protein [Spartinivicinus marinus]MCX4026179.1 transporter substrate-binding domain-containing protein [Spartinivicinus marinus]NYZ68711.1 transporter substrate-binding domain-containing protein [Spartinivicinus marinus]